MTDESKGADKPNSATLHEEVQETREALDRLESAALERLQHAEIDKLETYLDHGGVHLDELKQFGGEIGKELSEALHSMHLVLDKILHRGGTGH